MAWLTVRCLYDQRYLAEEVIAQLGLGDDAGDVVAERIRGRTRALGVSTVLRTGLDLRDELRLPPPADVLRALGRRLCAAHGRPLLLFVDEAQELGRIDDHGDRARARVAVQDLHQAVHGMPILTVYAGLAPTAAVLGDMGVSRESIESLVELGRLSPAESLEVARGTLAVLRVGGPPDVLERWATACAGRSDDWPQHLTNNLRACCKEFLRHAGHAPPGDLDAAMDHAADLREASYKQRRGPALHRAHHDLVARAVGGCMARGALDRPALMAALLDALRDGAPEVPEGNIPGAAVELFDRAVHRGLLRETSAADGTYECPIPSFRAHLEKFAAGKHENA